MADDVIGIDALLAELGYVAEPSRRLARRVLERAGLTNPRKQNISLAKRDDVVAALDAGLRRHCGTARCARATADDPRPEAIVEKHACPICGGSDNAGAVSAMVQALVSAKRPRLLIVGGSPNTHAELRRLLDGTGVALDIVDGTVALSSRRADERASAADVIAIWGGTQLNHKVSAHFSRPTWADRRLTVDRRGIAALADAVVRHVEGGRDGAR